MTTTASAEAWGTLVLSNEEDRLSAFDQGYNAGVMWFALVGPRQAPLSGEWAGESMPEIGDRYGIDLGDEAVADGFEEGFFWTMARDEDERNER